MNANTFFLNDEVEGVRHEDPVLTLGLGTTRGDPAPLPDRTGDSDGNRNGGKFPPSSWLCFVRDDYECSKIGMVD